MTQEKNEQRENKNKNKNTSQKDACKAQWIGIEHWPFLISDSKTCFSCAYFIFIWLNVFIWKQRSKPFFPFSDVTFFFFCCYSWILIFFWWVLRAYSSPISDYCPKDQKSTHIKPGYTDHFNLFTNLLHISHLRILLNESGLRSPYVWTFNICQGFISIYLQRLNCS